MARLNLLEETRYEKVPVKIYDTDSEASLDVAKRIATIIKQKQAEGKTRNVVGKMKDGVRDMADKLKDNEHDRTVDRDEEVA